MSLTICIISGRTGGCTTFLTLKSQFNFVSSSWMKSSLFCELIFTFFKFFTNAFLENRIIKNQLFDFNSFVFHQKFAFSLHRSCKGFTLTTNFSLSNLEKQTIPDYLAELIKKDIQLILQLTNLRTSAFAVFLFLYFIIEFHY